MKFLRVARLDDTDERVYPLAARVGELAVPGTFVFTFSDQDPALLQGKERQAFRHGFLGTSSFGWSTLAVISEISEAEFKGVIDALAHHFVEFYGAPSLEEALPYARAEAEYAAGLCEHEVNTLIAVERTADAEGIHESFKVVTQTVDWEAANSSIWQLVAEENDELG